MLLIVKGSQPYSVFQHDPPNLLGNSTAMSPTAYIHMVVNAEWVERGFSHHVGIITSGGFYTVNPLHGHADVVLCAAPTTIIII